jgi:hypothetical protein
MSSLFQNFKMDTVKELEGVEIPFAPNKDGSVPTFKISRITPSNHKYTKMMERETKPYRRQIELKTLDDMLAQHIAMKVFVYSILQGWSNVHDANDTPISFSPENAMLLFEQLPDLYQELNSQANNAALFRLEEIELAAKNS